MNIPMPSSRYGTPLYEDFDLSDVDTEDWTDTMDDQDYSGQVERCLDPQN